MVRFSSDKPSEGSFHGKLTRNYAKTKNTHTQLTIFGFSDDNLAFFDLSIALFKYFKRKKPNSSQVERISSIMNFFENKIRNKMSFKTSNSLT